MLLPCRHPFESAGCKKLLQRHCANSKHCHIAAIVARRSRSKAVSWRCTDGPCSSAPGSALKFSDMLASKGHILASKIVFKAARSLAAFAWCSCSAANWAALLLDVRVSCTAGIRLDLQASIEDLHKLVASSSGSLLAQNAHISMLKMSKPHWLKRYEPLH